MSPVFHYMVNCQIDKTNIKRSLLFHQGFPKMVDRGILFEIVFVAESLVRKEGVFPKRRRTTLVLLQELALPQPLKKCRINGSNLVCKLILKPLQPLFSAFVSPPVNSFFPAIFRSLGTVEQPNSPQRFSIPFDNPVLFICYSPANGVSANVKSKKIFSH